MGFPRSAGQSVAREAKVKIKAKAGAEAKTGKSAIAQIGGLFHVDTPPRRLYNFQRAGVIRAREFSLWKPRINRKS
jgi:hypothetical protein